MSGTAVRGEDALRALGHRPFGVPCGMLRFADAMTATMPFVLPGAKESSCFTHSHR